MEENLLSQTTIEVQKQMDSKYLEIVEKTNEQLNHNINISSNIISSASWLIAFLAVGVTIYLFYISYEQRLERKKTRRRYEKQLIKIQERFEEKVKEITIFFEETRNTKEELDKQISQTIMEKEKIKLADDTPEKIKTLEEKIKDLELKRQKINTTQTWWNLPERDIQKLNTGNFHTCKKCGVVFSKKKRNTIFRNSLASDIFNNFDYASFVYNESPKCPNCNYQELTIN